jgi:hypothetical protein
MPSSDDNEQVAKILAETPQSVPDVLAIMEKLQDIADRCPPRDTEDGLASFNYLYHVITTDVRDKIENGGFDNPEFLTRLDVEFAKRYFSAIEANATGAVTPRSWSVLLERRSDPDIDPLLFAVAGVNAHVNYDLAFALLTTVKALGLSLDDAGVRDDYQVINKVFADHMRELKQHFEGRLAREIDQGLLEKISDDAGDLTVVVARDEAWHRAVHINSLADDPDKVEHARAAIDWRVSMLGRAVLSLRV